MEKAILVPKNTSDYKGIVDYRGVRLQRFHCSRLRNKLE